MSDHRNRDKNMFVPTVGGNNIPEKIHVAHRRSQSELTNLMIEQFTLQRQLEAVNAQQQQLLQQQQQLSQQASQYLNTGNNGSNMSYGSNHYMGNQNGSKYYGGGNNGNGQKSASHSRNNSGYHNYYNSHNAGFNDEQSQDPNYTIHRRTGSQSSVYGHSRRQSLGLNEAKKAAAEEQAKRGSPAPLTVEESTIDNDGFKKPSSFKFPPHPSSPVNQTNHSGKSYSRRNSTNPNELPSFKFPRSPTAKSFEEKNVENNDDDFILTSSTHHRSKSRTNDSFSSSSSNNWRNHYQPPNQQQSPFRHGQSNSKDFGSFGGLEPPAYFQKGHRSRASNGSIQIYHNNNASQRKSLFAPYLPQANIPELIKEGRLVTGILRVNKKNRSDAWVSTDGVLDSDIYICGSKDRNRALEGDLVAVELLVVDDVWESKKEKEQKKRRKDATSQKDLATLDSTDDYYNDASANTAVASSASKDQNNDEKASTSPSGSVIKRRGSLKQRPTQKKNDDVEVEGQSLLLTEEEEISDDYKPLYAGHVVAVLDRIPGQLFSGTLGILRPSQQSQSDNHEKHNDAPKIVWFKPTDKKVPLLAIPTEFAPKDFVQNSEKYNDKTFVASIKRWPITSLHPFGILISELGETNDPTIEIDSILRDNNFLSNEYFDPKRNELEKTDFQVNSLTNEELMARKQFTPDTNCDIIAVCSLETFADFAIHVKDNDDGTLELGCHVIDVTSHITENSSLDRRARKRSTAVFMPQKTVGLLPQELNKLLSLNQNRASATISVIYTLNSKTFEVESEWIGESCVKPSLVMSIEDIDQNLSGTTDLSYFSRLEEVARALYSKRVGIPNSSLSMASALFETLDDEKIHPDLNILDQSIGYTIISELQKTVNATIAKKIHESLGPVALLRRQLHPIHTKLKLFKLRVQKLGFDVNISSLETLLQSINKIEDADAKLGVELLLHKIMPRAKYIVVGKANPSQLGNFITNIQLYTHFTAPFRRYADHIVHRQLKAALSGVPYNEAVESLKITSDYCNFKKDCAYHAQEQAIHLLMCKTINAMSNSSGQLLTMATVLQVYESSFDIFIPEFGIEKRVHGDQLPLQKAEFDANKKVLELFWQPGVDSATFVPEDEQVAKSYRNSIKNKFKTTTKEIASIEAEKSLDNQDFLKNDMLQTLKEMNVKEPMIKFPDDLSTEDPLSSFIKTASTRIEDGNYLQEIKELQHIPILLRAEIGMALPCLTVRALNPFINEIKGK